MTTTAARVFCDTNIVLRLLVQEMPHYAAIRAAIDRLLDNGATLWISRQIIREFCVVLTRPQTFVHPLPTSTVVGYVRAFPSLFRVVDETDEVTTALLALLDTIPCGGKQIHDANIVATMRAYGIGQLLTLNGADFRRFEPSIAILTPEEVLR